MKRVGEILREKRQALGLSLEEVSQSTHVRTDYLKAIEEGDYAHLPDHIYTQGFIRSYASALGLEGDKVVPFYRRERKDLNQKKEQKLPQPIRDSKFRITPEIIFSVIITLFVVGFLAFLFFQYRTFAGAPVLIIDSPPNNYVTEANTVEVTGSAGEGVEVTVNGQPVNQRLEGNFSITFQLNDGINRIRIVAVNNLGKRTVEERLVEKRGEDPTPTPELDVENTEVPTSPSEEAQPTP